MGVNHAIAKRSLKPPSLKVPSLKPRIFKAAIFEGAIFKAINTKATQAAFAEKFSRSTNALNEIIQELNDPDITHATSAIVGSAHATSVIVGSELIPEVNEKH